MLHYNLDKSLLVAGRSEPKFGGGEILKPMRFVLGDRATRCVGDHSIPLDSVIEDSIDHWIKTNLPHVDPKLHFALQNEVQPGSSELAGIFERGRSIANDTSAAVGYAPVSETERIVLATEHYLNSPETKRRSPVIGEDVKIMAVRDRDRLGLTIAIAMVDQYVRSQDDYFEQKRTIVGDVQKFVESQIQDISQVDIQLNALDDPERAMQGMYLTVAGTSAECGDSGQVGRGNNVRGLISLNRPVSNEAAAGKNPVSHIGKIYNLLSYQMAERIYETVPGVEEVYVWLVGRIGQPVDDPWLVSANLKLQHDAALADIDQDIRGVIENELASLPAFCQRLITGAISVC